MFVKIHQTYYFKLVHFIICVLYFNEAGLKLRISVFINELLIFLESLMIS